MFLNMSFIDRIIIILWLELKLNSFYVFRWRCGFKIEEWNGKEPNLVIKGATKVFDFKNNKIKLTEIIIKSPLRRIVNKKTIDWNIHITKILNLIPVLYWNTFELCDIWVWFAVWNHQKLWYDSSTIFFIASR